MILHQQKVLQQLQKENLENKNLRDLISSNQEIWQPLSELLKPTTKEETDDKKLLFQNKILKFLNVKKAATELLMLRNFSPDVSLPHKMQAINSYHFRPGLDSTTMKCQLLTKS